MKGLKTCQKMSSSPALYKLDLPDLEAVTRFAATLAPHLRTGDVLRLEGELGVGKTTFTRALIAALAGTEVEVPSPTFTLVQHYDLPPFTLYHFDLYRIKHSAELLEIGLEQALQEGVSIIEWPEIAASFLPPESLTIRLSFAEQGRHAELLAPDPSRLQGCF